MAAQGKKRRNQPISPEGHFISSARGRRNSAIRSLVLWREMYWRVDLCVDSWMVQVVISRNFTKWNLLELHKKIQHSALALENPPICLLGIHLRGTDRSQAGSVRGLMGFSQGLKFLTGVEDNLGTLWVSRFPGCCRKSCISCVLSTQVQHIVACVFTWAQWCSCGPCHETGSPCGSCRSSYFAQEGC